MKGQMKRKMKRKIKLPAKNKVFKLYIELAMDFAADFLESEEAERLYKILCEKEFTSFYTDFRKVSENLKGWTDNDYFFPNGKFDFLNYLSGYIGGEFDSICRIPGEDDIIKLKLEEQKKL